MKFLKEIYIRTLGSLFTWLMNIVLDASKKDKKDEEEQPKG